MAGIDLPLIENRGHVILVVASDAATNMAEELDQLRMDMIGDGWEVSNIVVELNDTGKLPTKNENNRSESNFNLQCPISAVRLKKLIIIATCRPYFCSEMWLFPTVANSVRMDTQTT